MAKKKTKKSSNQDLFKKHKHLKWLLPLFALAVLGFLLAHHQMEEDSSTERDSTFKQEIKEKLQMDTDKETNDDAPISSPDTTKSY